MDVSLKLGVIEAPLRGGLEQTVNCRIHKHKINKPPSPTAFRGQVVSRGGASLPSGTRTARTSNK